MEDSRVVWIRVLGISAHVWCAEFFVELAIHLGNFICIDEHTASGAYFNVVRLMLRVKIAFKTPEELKLTMDDTPFTIFLREDNYGSSMACAAGISKS